MAQFSLCSCIRSHYWPDNCETAANDKLHRAGGDSIIGAILEYRNHSRGMDIPNRTHYINVLLHVIVNHTG